MRIVIAAVGRARPGPAADLFREYARRLPWALSVQDVEPAAARGARRREQEAAGLLKAVPEDAMVVALDERGTLMTSTEFAAEIGRVRDDGRGVLAFLIGGADGHAEAVRQRADLVLSLGPMTWPHQLVRPLLAEQLYRAASILAGHPYHRN